MWAEFRRDPFGITPDESVFDDGEEQAVPVRVHRSLARFSASDLPRSPQERTASQLTSHRTERTTAGTKHDR